MKASVIIPAWGDTPCLKEALSALDAQGFRDFETIVRAPPDDERNAGAARNAGLAAASGDWLFFVDADDLPEPDMIETAIEAGERTGADVVAWRADEVDAVTGRRNAMPYLARLVPWADGRAHALDELGDRRFTTLGLAPWNKAVRRSFVAANGLRFQSIARSNDLAFTVELLFRAKTFVALGRSLIGYRVNNAGSLQHTNAETPECFIDALGEAKRRIGTAFPVAFSRLEEETTAYNLHSVRTLAAYRELCLRLGRAHGIKGTSALLFRICRALETLRDRGPVFCLRGLYGKAVAR